VLSNGTYSDWIAIESKLDSREGDNQLPRYAEVLAAQKDVRRKFLLYITRDYDPKDSNLILHNLPDSTVQYKELRWYRFYHFLQSHPPNILIDEVIKFMEENGMAQDNHFSIVDVLALSNIHRVFGLMDETLNNEVRARFQKVVGPVDTKSKIFRRFGQWGAYYLYCPMAPEWHCGLGYRVPDAPGDYPTAELYLKVFPKAQSYDEIFKAMQEIVRRSGWDSWYVDEAEQELIIRHSRSLGELVGKEDNVAEIKAFFLTLLDELSEIKRQYPHLPWDSSFQQDSESEEE
jgi:hypothetical protein